MPPCGHVLDMSIWEEPNLEEDPGHTAGIIFLSNTFEFSQRKRGVGGGGRIIWAMS